MQSLIALWSGKLKFAEQNYIIKYSLERNYTLITERISVRDNNAKRVLHFMQGVRKK